MASPRLVACASCGCHALAAEARCTHCDAPLRRPDGSFEVTKVALFLGIAALAAPLACSGSASSSGGGGGGGDGGGSTTGGGTSNNTTASVTTSTTNAVTSSTVSTYATSVTTTSTSSGTCDSGGDCGDSSFGCIACALSTLCADVYDACASEQLCIDFSTCSNACADQACYDQCVADNPLGADLYDALLNCILCEACYFDCDGASAGCP